MKIRWTREGEFLHRAEVDGVDVIVQKTLLMAWGLFGYMWDTGPSQLLKDPNGDRGFAFKFKVAQERAIASVRAGLK